MAEIKVSELTEANNVNDEDLIMIIQNGVNKKVAAKEVGTGAKATVVNNLESDSEVDGLAAKQGKVLNEKIKKLGEYSTEETLTGETWIDGKPIYRKVITGITPSKLGNWNEISDIPNVNEVITMFGIFVNSTGNSIFHIPYAKPSNNEEFLLYYSKTNQKIYEQHNYAYASGSKYNVIVEYTKTTD